MSQDSSKSQSQDDNLPKRDLRHLMRVALKATGLLSWVLLSFIAAQLIVGLGWVGLVAAIPAVEDISSSVTQFILTALIYLMTLTIVIGGSFLIRQRVTVKELAINKRLTWLDLGLAPATFIGYIVVSSVVMMAITQTIPGFDIQQTQEIGFDSIVGRTDLLVAFLALVIFAPIAEEVLFRGYLYGKLRGLTGAIAASVLTSVLFGAVHMQWNVAIDTFILSMAMCGLREITGSIWAGTLVHMLKNGLAFFLLFIFPVLSM